MPAWIARILDWRYFAVFARIVLTSPFWINGVWRITNMTASVIEIDQYDLPQAWLINYFVIFVELGGSLLVVANRRTWSGAGALAIFTLMTILVAHRFWTLSGHAAQAEFWIALQHLGLIGGLMLAAILSRQSKYRGA